MDRPASAARRRKSQVFVEIPPSPFTAKSGKADRAGPPESTPLKAVAINVDNAPSPASTTSQLKRKSPEDAHTTTKQKDDAQAPRLKKSKTENAEAATSAKKPSNTGKADTDSRDAAKVVEGPVRCHQCSRQMLPEDMALCSFKRPNGQRCSFKYCKSCLRNRYEQDLPAIHATKPEGAPSEDRAQHADGVDYLFRCPRCSDNCNCRSCRKAKGLPATGNLILAARRASMPDSGDAPALPNGGASLKAKPIPSGSKNKQPTGDGDKIAKPKAAPKAKGKAAEPSKSRPSKGKPIVLIPPSPHHTKVAHSVPAKKPRVVQEKPAAPPKPIPKPVWTVLPTPLTFDDAFGRMNIREFLLRFAHLAEIARAHLEELEELATDDPYTTVANEENESEDSPLVGWISEPALRAVLVGLVSIFSKDADEKNEDMSAFTKAIHALRASGSNVNKMWAALAALRDAADFDLPDPLPPPPIARQRSTRRASQDSPSATVVCTAQFVPVVVALVEAALETKVVQNDFERAATQEKDLTRAARELSAAENTRFREAKAKSSKPDQTKGKSKVSAVSLAERRAAQAAHEAALAKYEFAHQVAAAECMPRFGPLGRDTEGRVYYAITPGVIEREAAVELLEGGKGDVKFGRRRVAEEDVRKDMKHWSWFVAIWGRKPEGAEVAKVENEDEQHEDEDEERWWAFWEPEQVSKLAEWLAMKYGIDLEAKRPAKDSGDSAVLDIDDADAVKIPAKDGDKKSRGRPSNASSTSSTRPRKFASLNKDSDSEDESGSEDDSDADGDVQMRLDARGEPVPTKNDLRALTRGLKDYAELLQWRIKRGAREGKEGSDEKPSAGDKGKGVDKGGISPATFYGK